MSLTGVIKASTGSYGLALLPIVALTMLGSASMLWRKAKVLLGIRRSSNAPMALRARAIGRNSFRSFDIAAGVGLPREALCLISALVDNAPYTIPVRRSVI